MADPVITQDQQNQTAFADSAIKNRDVGALTQLAKDNIGTPAGEVALELATSIKKSKTDFDNLVGPIEKKGGAATPEGRVEFVERFKSVADNPQMGQALIAMIMGQKEAAYNLITGGTPKTTISYDNNGDQIVETINAVGEPLSYFHRGLNRNITQQEYNQLKGGISLWENSLKGKIATKTSEQARELYVKEEQQANAWHQLMQAHKPMLQDTYNTLKTFKTDLPPDLYNKIVGSVSQSMGQASTRSNNVSVLNQLTDAIGRGEGVKVDQKIASALNLGKDAIGATLKVEGNNLVSKDNNIKIDVSKLKQQQTTDNIGSEATKNASSTMQSLAEAERLGQVNPTAAQRLRRVIETSQQMGRELMDATEKFGRPSFISLPTSASFTDKQAQTLAQTLQSMQNVEQMDQYIRYRQYAKEGYDKTNTVPMPGEVGTNYTRQPIYNDMRNFYSNEIGKVMEGEYQAKKQAAPAAAPAAAPTPAAPPVARPAPAAAPAPAAPAPAAAAAPPATRPAPPTAGTVEKFQGKNYRFKGGNPADQKNWEEVK